nr:EamA family transporter [Actinomycetota bacterium]
SAGAVSASYVSYLVPVFGVGWGWLALGEQVRALSLVGMFVVLAGLWMLLGAGAGAGAASAQPESLVEPAN